MNHKVSPPSCTFCKKKLTTYVLENILINKNFYNLYKCDQCKIGMLHPFPSEEELTKLYSCGNYRTKTGKRFGSTIEFLIYLGRLRKRGRISQFVKVGKILDIGCGRGLFLDVMRRGGWDPIGTELNEIGNKIRQKSQPPKIGHIWIFGRIWLYSRIRRMENVPMDILRF